MGVYPLVFLFLALGGVNSEYFKYEKCSKGDDEYISIQEFNIKPDPIDLKKDMSVTLLLNLKKPLPENAVLKTTYYKIKGIFGLELDFRIGCFLGKFGSCTNSFCKYLEGFKEQAQILFPKDVPYGCPMKPGDYGGKDLQMPIPDMGYIARFILGGKYRTELELIVDGKVTDCYKLWAEMR